MTDVPLESVTALVLCCSGFGLAASSVDLLVVLFEVFCALVGCTVLRTRSSY